MSLPFIVLCVCMALVLYTYIGYALLIYLLNRFISKPEVENYQENIEWPAITVIIPAYNECGILYQKIKNTLASEYPHDLLSIILVTDGSNDGREKLEFSDSRITHLHQHVRQGKSAAINQGVAAAKTDILFITGDNTMIHSLAINAMA